jgi:hypothetical protein
MKTGVDSIFRRVSLFDVIRLQPPIAARALQLIDGCDKQEIRDACLGAVVLYEWVSTDSNMFALWRHHRRFERATSIRIVSPCNVIGVSISFRPLGNETLPCVTFLMKSNSKIKKNLSPLCSNLLVYSSYVL